MESEAPIDIGKLASEYLSCIQSLSEELACATVAIAENNLPALEAHIAAQQTLCAQILVFDKMQSQLMAYTSTQSAVTAAWQHLLRNKQVYAKLVAASGRAHHVLLTLCRTYDDSSSHAADQALSARSLSCEV